MEKVVLKAFKTPSCLEKKCNYFCRKIFTVSLLIFSFDFIKSQTEAIKMTQPGTEPQTLGPLVNTLLTRPIFFSFLLFTFILY